MLNVKSLRSQFSSGLRKGTSGGSCSQVKAGGDLQFCYDRKLCQQNIKDLKSNTGFLPGRLCLQERGRWQGDVYYQEGQA